MSSIKILSMVYEQSKQEAAKKAPRPSIHLAEKHQRMNTLSVDSSAKKEKKQPYSYFL